MKFKYISTVTLLALGASVATGGDNFKDYASGRTDKSLKLTVKKVCRPLTYIRDESELWGVVIDIDSRSDLTVTDVYTGLQLIPDFDGDVVGRRSVLNRMIDKGWFVAPKSYVEDASVDLHNLRYIALNTAAMKDVLPLGDVNRVEMTDGSCKKGASSYDGEIVEFIEPSPEYKGDIARSIFYMVSVYPATLWSGWGTFVFQNNEYPTLFDFLSETYLKWHREDPVSEEELQRNESITYIQGNINPFVLYPELAEYIWGCEKGNPFPGGNASGEGAGEETRTPIRGTYRISDGYIYLYSPYIPADAEFYIDGVKRQEKVSLRELGCGDHELRFRNDNVSGKLKFSIEP